MQSKTRVTAAIVLLSILQGLSFAQSVDEEAPSTGEPAATLESVFEEFNDLETPPLTQQEERYANMISQGAAAADWMGALTPVAISPFFGITCLSGVAIFAEDYLPEGHFLRRASSPLRQPLVFGAFLTLTIVTAIPKLSKVSKPFAQACDQLETYSALVVLLVIRVMGQQATGLEPGEEVAVVYQAGVFEFSLETLLLLASAANILIINAVKFFFEILIWITPVPFIDAIFEASSKAAVVALTALYAWNPTIATAVNLALAFVCLLIFAWVRRREVYYRSMLFRFLTHWLGIQRARNSEQPLEVFPEAAVGSIPKRARCLLSTTDDGWELTMPRFLRSPRAESLQATAPTLKSGWLMDRIESVGGPTLSLGKQDMATIAQVYRLQMAPKDPTITKSSSLPAEFA